MAEIKTSTPKAMPKRLHSRSSTSSNESIVAAPKKLRHKSPIAVNEDDENSDYSSVDEPMESNQASARAPERKPAIINWDEMLEAMAVAMTDLDNPFTKGLTYVINQSEKLSSVVERLDSLENKMAEKDLTIHEMQNDITSLTKKIDEKEDEIVDLRAELEEVKTEMQTISDKQTSFDKQCIPEKLDELDQYGRRSMIRLSGVPDTNENENTLDVVLDIFKKKLGIELQKSDIDRTHRLGPLDSKSKTPRAIVVKFSSYPCRSLVYGERRKLMNSGLFINDHLTATRARLLYFARQYKKLDLITNAWTAEGRILVRDKADKKTHAILSIADLTPFDPTGKFKFPDNTPR